MNTTAVKVVLDTNIFITIIGKESPFRWIFDAVLNGNFILCISNEILLEYQEVLARKTTREIADSVTNFLVTFPYIQKTDISYRWNLIEQDKDDNKFIDCAVSASAYCIVSNDNHFKPFRKLDFPPLNILTLQEFEEEFKDAF